MKSNINIYEIYCIINNEDMDCYVKTGQFYSFLKNKKPSLITRLGFLFYMPTFQGDDRSVKPQREGSNPSGGTKQVH